MSRESILKSKLEVEQDRFKVGVSLVVILTSGLVGLMLKEEQRFSDYILAFGGAVADVLIALYTFRAYYRVNRILNLMEESCG